VRDYRRPLIRLVAFREMQDELFTILTDWTP
jgi:hypothetical protein